jgi:hypothetical protein
MESMSINKETAGIIFAVFLIFRIPLFVGFPD